MKIKYLLPIILLPLSNFAATPTTFTPTNSADVINKLNAELTKQNQPKTFYEKFELRPYASAIADKNVLDFTSGAIGLETVFNVNKNVGLSFDLLGRDNMRGSLVDRLGLNLVTRLPLSKKTALYAEGGFGYWFGTTDDFDMVFRGGAQYNFTDNIGAWADIGQGFIFESGGSYQQVRAGIKFSF